MAKWKKPESDLKETVKSELAKMLAATEEPSEGRMKLLKLSIGYLAVEAKLEENEYGDFFRDGDAGGVPSEIEKPAARRRKANGTGAGLFPAEGAES